jgi:CRISPR-associated protein Cmr2
LTRALRAFSESVPTIVNDHSGRCVYAGGDDVLAMLPVTTAVNCASAIRQEYLKAFKQKELSGSISAGVLFAHYKLPFSTLLQEAHHLLDDIAKDTTGRDSIAIALHKGSGLTAQWSVPWDYFLGEDIGSGRTDLGWFRRLQSSLRDARRVEEETEENSANGEEAKISASFLYNLRQRVGTLSEEPIDHPGNYVTWPFEAFDRLEFFVSEWMVGKRPPKSEEERIKLQQRGKQLLEPLAHATKEAKRKADKSTSVSDPSFNLDAAFLARFIAGGGKENS